MSMPQAIAVAHPEDVISISVEEVSEFSPAEIRLAIVELVTKDKNLLANALVDAGLSLYPDSEDILAIAALLAETQADWQTAESHLEHLTRIQGNACTPTVFRHLIRVQVCLCEVGKAILTARRALDIYPGHDEIIEEYARLTQDYAEGFVPNAPPHVQ